MKGKLHFVQDHFYLVGPTSNPADLDATNDDILTMFNKIVTVGNQDIAVSFPILFSVEIEHFFMLSSYFRHPQLRASRPVSFLAMTRAPPTSRNLNFSSPLVKYVLHSIFSFHSRCRTSFSRTGTLGTRLLQMVPPIPTFPSSSPRSCLRSLGIHHHRPRHLALFSYQCHRRSHRLQSGHRRCDRPSAEPGACPVRRQSGRTIPGYLASIHDLGRQ